MSSRNTSPFDALPFDYEMEPAERFSEAVVSAVTAVSGYEPVALPDGDGRVLPPLYDFVDPDALDTLLGRTPDDGPGADRLRFDYDEFEVTVEAAGTVRVRTR
ncbi:HalOD1 output domain-containing protein [Halostella litorea]|uniref:HalOD1 output domain-containing protein n=1 Tax=Halostella litorea TaxID=2528831 RepID=UPI001F38D873|nr:HalOD1 output domain-containing protein [Halostella litorea]